MKIKKKKFMYICCDFDGTLCEHVYPQVGEEVPKAFDYCKKYQEAGIKLILFTMRSGKELEEAVEWCKERGLEFYGINTNPTQKFWTKSPKAYGNLYMDDAAAGCPLIKEDGKKAYVDWDKINEIVVERIKENELN